LDNEGIIALIPAHNESARIAEIVTAACVYLPVLVVDDGSHDDTAARAEKAGARVIRHPSRQGKGAALVTGFRWCLQEGIRAAVTLDGDGQHDPDEIPKFLDYWTLHRVGLLIGQRDFSHIPGVRRTSNTFGRWMMSRAVGQDIPDNQSGYRLVSRQLMEVMVENQEKGFEFEVDMVPLCLKHRLGLGWVPIHTIYTGGKSHVRYLPHVINYFRAMARARRIVRKG
jgi:glycosyltransferase involved in cell wall biosynthesis